MPATKPRENTGTRRFNVNFPPSVYQVLEELADRRGKTMAEVLRDAIALEKWYQDARDEGARVLVERNGQFRELVRF